MQFSGALHRPAAGMEARRFYKILSTCSLIFSSSSFIWTTSRWMVASLAFRSHRVDLAAHLLGDESQLAAHPPSRGGHLAEVAAVVRQAHLLFGDVEVFEVEDHLLLKAVAVPSTGSLARLSGSGRMFSVRALLEGYDLLLLVFDQIDAAQQVGLIRMAPSCSRKAFRRLRPLRSTPSAP